MDIHLGSNVFEHSININGHPYTSAKSLDIRLEPDVSGKPRCAEVRMISYLDQNFNLSGSFSALLGLPSDQTYDIQLHISEEGYSMCQFEGKDGYFEVFRAAIRTSVAKNNGLVYVDMEGYWVPASSGDTDGRPTSMRISGIMCETKLPDTWAGEEQP